MPLLGVALSRARLGAVLQEVSQLAKGRWRYARGVSFARITIDPAVMAGVPTLRGLRIPVATLVAMVADGMTTEEILRDLPDLEVEDIQEALQYAAEELRERHLPLQPSA